MPPPQVLHRITLDVLKALDTYHKPYIAAFRYRSFERMEQVKAPTLLLKPETELALLNASVATALERLANGHSASTPGDAATKATVIATFLAENAA